jgi:hypothetical protein
MRCGAAGRDGVSKTTRLKKQYKYQQGNELKTKVKAGKKLRNILSVLPANASILS